LSKATADSTVLQTRVLRAPEIFDGHSKPLTEVKKTTMSCPCPDCENVIALAHEEYLKLNGPSAHQPVRRLTAIGDCRKGFSVIFRDEEHKVLAMYDIVMTGDQVTFEPVTREQDPERFEYFDVVEQ
jgi:hypothetical protein